ncbi:MAG: PQQ-binding-like beta-propeller repeat protein [Bryobacterales bacterium]|nr:PQQ-binding-like beta-propeller repeat protein [Bryobacterales bacterium]
MRAFLILLAAQALMGADWPQWRGVNRDGISAETGLMKSWPEGGPKQVWKATGLGEGFSSFAVVKGRIYTQGQRENQEYVMAFDAATGKKLWETPAGSAFRERRGHGPRGTPAVDGTVLYALSADGTLVCLNVADGKQVWSQNIVDRYKGEVPHWGISESPLVDGDRVVVTPGGSDGTLVALNKKTGAPLWRTKGSDAAAYSSPIVVNNGKVRQYVTLTSGGAVGVSASTGELLWRYDKVANRTANIATPIFAKDHIFVSTDYGTGCALLKVAANGSATEVYFNREMKNHYSSSVLVGEHLYGFSSQVLTAMNFLTGEVAWRDRTVGKGSVTLAEGMLYVFSERGQMALVEANPAGYQEKGRFAIPAGDFNTWTPPVIANGRLYLREQDNLYSFDIAKK